MAGTLMGKRSRGTNNIPSNYKNKNFSITASTNNSFLLCYQPLHQSITRALKIIIYHATSKEGA
jgi:hypothetical protein